MGPISNRVANAVLWSVMGLTRLGAWRRFVKAASTPKSVQEDVLHRIVHANAQTEFGQAHGFSAIDGPDAYRRAVPVQTYETLRPYIERQENSGVRSLTTEQPVFYQRTSGTLGTPKDIPLTKSGVARIRGYQRLSALAQFSGSRIFEGRILGIAGPAIEGYTPSGMPFGSATGLIYETQPAVIRSKFVLPAEVFGIADYETRYYVIAAMGMAEPMVTGVVTANPSTLVRLLDVMNDHAEQLFRDLERGRLSVDDRLTPAQRMAVATAFRKAPKRAHMLADLLMRNGAISYTDVWPNLAGIVTWTGGSCSVPLSALKGRYPDQTAVMEVGYAASEFRGTLNVDVAQNACLPTLCDHFFEFVQRDEWERGEDNFLGLDELSEDESYYVFVTTADGLYRYDINDIVSVTGRIAATPTLAFVQKGRGVTNITGEKLHENQVIHAIQTTCEALAMRTVFFVTLADEQQARYVAYLEASCAHVPAVEVLADAIDRRLRTLNLEYDAKRSSRRLKPLHVQRLMPGTGDVYRRYCVSNGQRDAQYKVMHLQYAHECDFDFCAHSKEQLRP